MAIAHGVLGFADMQASDYAGARAALEESGRDLVRANLYFWRSWARLLRCSSRACSAPAGPIAEGGPSRAVARKAWRESRFARFIGWRFPNYAPHALRVSGRAAFALGKTKKAARYLERAIAAAENLGARYDLARALLDASLVIPEKADDYRRRGQQLLDELGAVVPEAERLRLLPPSGTRNPHEPAHEGRSEAVGPRIQAKQERSKHVAARPRRHPCDQAATLVGGQFADRPGDPGELLSGARVVIEVGTLNLPEDDMATPHSRPGEILAERFVQALVTPNAPHYSRRSMARGSGTPAN